MTGTVRVRRTHVYEFNDDTKLKPFDLVLQQYTMRFLQDERKQ